MPALALSAGACHKGGVGRLRDFDGINAFFGDREIDELQAAIDARRQARAQCPDGPEDGAGPGAPETDARPLEQGLTQGGPYSELRA